MYDLIIYQYCRQAKYLNNEDEYKLLFILAWFFFIYQSNVYCKLYDVYICNLEEPNRQKHHQAPILSYKNGRTIFIVKLNGF